MGNYRHRMTMCLEKESYDELGYVKAGKIFHLDGIDKGNTSGAWTDLVGGFVFTNNALCCYQKERRAA